MYSKVIMVGNLTRDIELRYLPSGSAVAKSAIATSFKYKSATGEQKEDVCFLDFNMFNRSAEIANQYLKKGSKVLLEGRLVFEQWTAQDGSSRSRHSLRVDVMKMLDGKKEGESYSNDSHEDNSGVQHSQPNTSRPQNEQPASRPQPQYEQPASRPQPQPQYEQPASRPQSQPQYEQPTSRPQYNGQPNNGQPNNGQPSNSQPSNRRIPEIDIDEDEIPF